MQKGITAKENEVDPLMWNRIHCKTEKKQCGEAHMSKGSLGEIDVKSGLPGGVGLFHVIPLIVGILKSSMCLITRVYYNKSRRKWTYSFFLGELCCGSNRRLLTFNLLKNFFPDSRPYSS